MYSFSLKSLCRLHQVLHAGGRLRRPLDAPDPSAVDVDSTLINLSEIHRLQAPLQSEKEKISCSPRM